MNEIEFAVLGGGCFWCTEAVFQRLNGVLSVEPGYAGGFVPNPSYQQVCTGSTGHAEVARVGFDPAVISYAELLDVFMHTHDPTTLNRQGNDVGPQYRSIILTASAQQEQTARETLQALAGSFPRPIVTEIVPLKTFYPAEDYHHNYYNDNSRQPYCQFVILPKIGKLVEKYGEKMKKLSG